LSKPLTRAEYIFGKLVILLTFLLLVTWVPAIVLLIVQIAFAGNFTFLTNHLYLFPAITVFACLEVTMVAVAMLALSSLSKSSRYVAILYAAVIFFTQAIYGVLYVVTRDSSMSWVSFAANLSEIGDLIFRLPPRYTTPWPVALAMIVGLIVVSGLILERRVRGVEVVA
jgi:ABC-type transport system involved in multi-copper enzyme maturation permease subunit